MHSSTGAPASTRSPPAVVLISRIARVVRQRVEELLAPLGLRQRQLIALGYLREHGPTPQKSLAQQLCMDASSLVCLLNQLEDRGLIVRRRDRLDRRLGIVELSSDGDRLLMVIDRALIGIDEEVLTGLDGEQREQLRDLLARLTAGEPNWGAAAAESAQCSPVISGASESRHSPPI
jgi:DNA-binding MarR family transcriptional regulator